MKTNDAAAAMPTNRISRTTNRDERVWNPIRSALRKARPPRLSIFQPEEGTRLGRATVLARGPPSAVGGDAVEHARHRGPRHRRAPREPERCRSDREPGGAGDGLESGRGSSLVRWR